MIYGYPEVGKILEYITRIIYFLEIRKRTEDYISQYTDYNQNKVNRYKLYETFKMLKILIRAWKNIIWDFIIKLLGFKEFIIGITYNSVLVIINRLTKYYYFILYKKSSTAKDLVYIFLRTIISQYRLFKKIILNRGILFTLNFWRSLIK